FRWNQPNFTDEIIQGYTVQCFFIEDLKEIEICEDKNITTTELEHTVHNLTFNTTYYFRVRAHTKIVAGPYTDLINVSTTHENPIPKLLVMNQDIQIWDVDVNNFTTLLSQDFAYSIQEQRIYWHDGKELMTLEINENKIIKIANYLNLFGLWIDWVTRNLYFVNNKYDGQYVLKFDLTMWENGISKFDVILQLKNDFEIKTTRDIVYANMFPYVRIGYCLSYNSKNMRYDMVKYYVDGKNLQIVPINLSIMYTCALQLTVTNILHLTMIDDVNNENPLIYWLTSNHLIVTDINVSMCNTILHNKNISDDTFSFATIDKTYIYISTNNTDRYFYRLEKKYASLNSVNADKYVEKIIIGQQKINRVTIFPFDQSFQPYPPIRCLTPDEKYVYIEHMSATRNSILLSIQRAFVKNGCEKYNLATTIYTISVSCLDNNLNESEKFNVSTSEDYYEIQDLTPFTEYKLKLTLSSFYYDQLSINPSHETQMKTKSGKLNAPENISVLALTPTLAVVYWMPPKKVNCLAVTYEVHWKLVNDTQQKSKQFTNVSKRMADGKFFTEINLSLPVQDYLIYVRVYPTNFSDFYNESLSKIVYSEPNIIILSEVNTNSMNISWISNINLTIFLTVQYKDIAAEEWQAMNSIKINYNQEVLYHIKNLQSGTSYMFRLILRYLEYEETFIWPADERFIFSTLG
ncbi:Proto-oncogene tyrosine-protein kinase ROS, partial [Camponotus floridanus]